MPSAALNGDQAPIVGRDHERALLYEQLEAALAGRGRLVIIGGRAGIGKTTLVRDLVERARERDALVFAGGCYDLTTTPPYGPWIEALHTYVPTDGQPDPPQEFSFDSSTAASGSLTDRFEQTGRFFAELSEQRPVVLVLEDIHWADEASLDLLRFIARRSVGWRLLVIATVRSDEMTPQHRLHAILPALVRESNPVRIDLRRLSVSAIGQMVEGRYRLASTDLQRLIDYLDNLGRGNPLYTEELIRTLDADGLLYDDGHQGRLADLDTVHIPPLLQQTISRRLSQLSEATRDALAMAAVIGQDVPLEHWSLVSGLNDAQLIDIVEEAISAYVLEERPDGIGLRFSHALVRESMYRSMALPLRRVRHVQVAEALAGIPGSSPHTAAYHFQQAGDLRAVEWFVRAGLRARGSEAWFSAAQAFEAAARLLEGNRDRATEYGWLRFEAGFLQRFSGDPGSIGNLNAAEQTGFQIPDPLLVGLAQYARGAQRAMRGQVRQGLEDTERGVQVIDSVLETRNVIGTEDQALSVIRSIIDDAASEANLNTLPNQDDEASTPRVNQQRGVLINWLSMSGRYKDAVVAGEPFMKAVVRAFGERHLLLTQCVTGHLGLAQAYAALGRIDEARREFARGRAGYREQRDFAILGGAIWREIVTLVLPYETDNLSRRAQMVAETVDTWSRSLGITILSDGERAPAEMPVDLLEGRWTDAVLMAKDYLTSPWVLLIEGALVTIGEVARHRGDFDQAWECAEKLFPQGSATEPGDSYFAITVSGVSLAAELAMDSGDLAAARQWLEMHDRWLAWSGAHTWLAENRLAWARWHMLSADLSAARQQANEAFQFATAPRQPLWLARVHRLLGSIDLRENHLESAGTHLRESVALAGACAAVFDRAVSQVALAELEMATLDHSAAKSLLEEAGETCLQLGALPTLQRIAALDANVASGLNSAPDAPDGLTAREREVLRLVASGMSNREIANELFLSPRTVERHIANIYNKINAHSKAEATAYAALHRLV